MKKVKIASEEKSNTKNKREQFEIFSQVLNLQVHGSTRKNVLTQLLTQFLKNTDFFTNKNCQKTQSMCDTSEE